MVPSMEDKPPLSALPVMHNVFDNDVPPDVQVGGQVLEEGSWQRQLLTFNGR